MNIAVYGVKENGLLEFVRTFPSAQIVIKGEGRILMIYAADGKNILFAGSLEDFCAVVEQ